MKFIQETFTFQGMRKPQSFVIYPCKATDNEVKLHSDNRIMRVDLSLGKALLSANKSGGAYFHDLSLHRGAKLIDIPGPDLERIKSMRDRMAGVAPNKDGTITILDKTEEEATDDYNVGE